MPPGKFRKNTPSEIESGEIFSNLSTFDVPVDTGTQNFLKFILSACLYSHTGYNIAEINIY